MKTVYERADIVPLLAEIFRELGYEGTSLSRITERTGIGKGSLYHFSPAASRRWRAPCSPMSMAGSNMRSISR